ncbi:hypothetical protein KSP39_PZI002627 [Platanthera zijinensis]|uniref:Uncharacterized protein n=1 Tax=Platanthera zijinensis TaxID=2320716 RepID=A0AAP0C0F6_9ASPA
MASESSVTDQSISELTGVKKLGDDTKEEEKHEPEDVSVADEINKEEEHKQVSSSSESALDANEGKLNDVVEIFTSKEPVNSVFKQEDLKPAEVAQTSENEIDPVSSNDKAEIELVESEDSKDDVHELMHTKVPIVIFPDASEVPEEFDVDRSTLTSISVPVKNLEAESGSPEEHKSEESAETKPDLELIKSISAVDSEAPEENNGDSITPTAIEVPLKDPESSFVSHEEKKLEEHGTKQHVELSRSEDCKEEVHELVPTEVSINSEVSEKSDVDLSARPIVEVLVKDFEVVSSSPEEQKAEVGAVKKNNVHLSVPTSAEVPLKDLEVESGSPEEQKPEVGVETKVDNELIESGESKGEGQDLVSGEVPTNTSEAQKENDVDLSIPTSTVVPVKLIESGDSKVEGQESVSASTSEEREDINTDLSIPTGIEEPVKDLEVESGSPEEQKIEESTETKVNTDFIESGESKDEGQASCKVPTDSSQASEINDVDLSIPTSTEVPVKDLEVESGSPEEQKPKEGAETKVNIKLIEPADSKVEGQESVSAEVSASTFEEREDNNSDLSTPTSIEVPVKDLEVESGSPEEEKIEESTETKANTDFVKLGESKDEGQASGEVPTSSSEAPEINNVDLSIPTSKEVSVKDLEVESSSPEEQKPEVGAETKVNIKLIESGDSKVEGQESVSAEVPASTSEERENNNTDLSTPTSIEVPVKDIEVESGSPEEQKIEESAETKVNTDFIKSGESKDEGQASGEVSTGSSQAPEINDVELTISTSTEVPVKDLEVESSSPEAQKSEEGAETKVNIKLIEPEYSKVEGQESVSAEVPSEDPASPSEECQENNADFSTPTIIEVPLKDLEVEFGYPEEKKFKGSAEIKVNTDFIKSGEFKDEGQDLVSGDVPTKTPEINDVDLSAPTSTEILVNDLEVESGSPVEQKSEVNIELMESGDSKVEGQEFVFAEVPGNTSNAPEKEDVELSTPTSTKVPLKDLEIKSGFPEEQKLEESAETNVDIESLKLGDSKDEGQESVDLTSPTSTKVPVKDVEVEFGSAEEQNPKESVETKEPSSDVTTIDGGGEVAESSSYEDRSSGAGEVVDKEDERLKEVIHTRIEEDQTPSDEDNVSEAVAVKKDDEFVENGIEGSTVLDVVLPVTEVFPDKVLEESKEETSEVDKADTAPKVSEVSLARGNVLEDANVEAIDKDLAETSIDSTAVGVSTGQAKIRENVEVEPLELKFEKLVVSPETSEVPSVGERVSAVYEKSETSKGEERKDETSEVDNTDTAPNVSLVSSAVGNVLEKNVNVEAIERDLYETSTDSTAGRVSTEQAKIREDVEVEPLELKFEELNVSPEASEVPSFGERFSTGDENSESSKGGEMKDETSEADNTDSTPEISEVSSAVGNVLEKDVNVEAIARDLAETGIDSTVDRVSTEQAKDSENVEVKPLELKFEEFNPKTSQVPSVGERVSTCDEKSESSKGETGVTLVETPSLAHLVEETENESSKNGTEASVEQFPEAVKEIIASESYNPKKDETPRDVSLEEKNTNVPPDKKSEVKVEGVIENAPEHEELGIKKRKGEKPKDEEPILSSDTRDVKLIRETTKRDSNIFTKVKRSIIKAKKAILGKSPGPKAVSSESKDENI